MTIFSNAKDEVYDSQKHQTSTYKAEVDCIEFSSLNISVKGDVKFVMFEAKKKEKMFHFWFNTNMIDDNKFVLHKSELDGKAVKDKKHEKYPENMMIEIIFAPDPTSPPLSLDKSSIPASAAQNNSSSSLASPPSNSAPPAVIASAAPAPQAPPAPAAAPQQNVQQQIAQLQQQFQNYQQQQAEYYKQYYQYFQQNPAAYQQYQVQQQQQQDQFNQQLSQLQQQLQQ